MYILEKRNTENLRSKYPSQEVRKRVASYVQRKPKRGNNKYKSRNSVKNKTSSIERSTKSKLVILKDYIDGPKTKQKNEWTSN